MSEERRFVVRHVPGFIDMDRDRNPEDWEFEITRDEDALNAPFIPKGSVLKGQYVMHDNWVVGILRRKILVTDYSENCCDSWRDCPPMTIPDTIGPFQFCPWCGKARPKKWVLS